MSTTHFHWEVAVTITPQGETHDTARIGTDMFVQRVQPSLGPADDGKFVAIDVLSGDFELDEDDYAAVTRLRFRRPTAEVWLERAGYPAAYQLRNGR
jgi:hypothetical protein